MVFLRVLSCVSCSMFLVQLLWFCDIELVNVFFGMCFRVLLIYWSGGYDIEIVMGPAFGIQSLYFTYRERELVMVFLCALFCVPSSLTGEGGRRTLAMVLCVQHFVLLPHTPGGFDIDVVIVPVCVCVP